MKKVLNIIIIFILSIAVFAAIVPSNSINNKKLAKSTFVPIPMNQSDIPDNHDELATVSNE